MAQKILRQESPLTSRTAISETCSKQPYLSASECASVDCVFMSLCVPHVNLTSKVWAGLHGWLTFRLSPWWADSVVNQRHLSHFHVPYPNTSWGINYYLTPRKAVAACPNLIDPRNRCHCIFNKPAMFEHISVSVEECCCGSNTSPHVDAFPCVTAAVTSTAHSWSCRLNWKQLFIETRRKATETEANSHDITHTSSNHQTTVRVHIKPATTGPQRDVSDNDCQPQPREQRCTS